MKPVEAGYWPPQCGWYYRNRTPLWVSYATSFAGYFNIIICRLPNLFSLELHHSFHNSQIIFTQWMRANSLPIRSVVYLRLPFGQLRVAVTVSSDQSAVPPPQINFVVSIHQILWVAAGNWGRINFHPVLCDCFGKWVGIVASCSGGKISQPHHWFCNQTRKSNSVLIRLFCQKRCVFTLQPWPRPTTRNYPMSVPFSLPITVEMIFPKSIYRRRANGGGDCNSVGTSCMPTNIYRIPTAGENQTL